MMKAPTYRPRGKRRNGKRRLLFAMVVGMAILLSQLAGWAQEPQTLDGIAAVINEEIITIGEVREAMAF